MKVTWAQGGCRHISGGSGRGWSEGSIGVRGKRKTSCTCFLSGNLRLRFYLRIATLDSNLQIGQLHEMQYGSPRLAHVTEQSSLIDHDRLGTQRALDCGAAVFDKGLDTVGQGGTPPM